MPGVPSNKACDRCKKRHVKCDEGRPGCQRCVAAGVDCPGYSQDRKFIDQGATVRRRYAPYQRNETRAQSSDRRLSTEEQDKEETSRPSVPTPGSRRSIGADNQMNHSTSDYFGSASGNQTPLQSETNLVSTAPYADLTASTGFLNAPQTVPDVPNTESLTFANPFDPFNSINSMQPPNLYGSNFENQTGLGSTVGTSYPFIDSQYSTVGNTNAVGDLYSELMINSERETAFLSRHYVEFIAPWLDLHDSEKFFAQTIPRRSILVPFIQSSILAIAAKHLARINGTKPLQDSKSRPATTETYPNVTGVNWQFKATHYFCQALLHMRQLVSGQVDSQQLDTTASPIHILCRDLEINVTSESAGPAVMPPTFVSNVDDIYPGLVILTLFDILDQPGTEWETRFLGLGHLLKCLLSFTGSHQNQTLMVSHALRASFWNLAYLDCFAAYANRRRTRVDAYNFDLFRAAGIPLDNQGLLNLYNAGNSLTVRPSSQRDDMFFRGITFIILKLMNFLAEFMEIQQAASTAASPVPDFLSNASVPQSSRLAVKWHQLLQEVSSWHNALPDTFQPYIHIQNPHDFLSATSASSPSLPFPEIVFSNATHASTMAVYNFARIILLLNRPYESQHTARDRLVEYREVTKQVDECTHELAGIAMGRTAPAVQIHFTQLLYVVGLCDDRPEAREKVVELLRGIRTEHGWETDYKIAQMQAMWNKG